MSAANISTPRWRVANARARFAICGMIDIYNERRADRAALSRRG